MKPALRRSRDCCLRKRAAVKRGGDFDRWDLEVRGGLLGCIRAVAMIEEHGAGKQLFRLRAWPQIPRPAIGLACRSGVYLQRSLLTIKPGLSLLRLGAGALGIATDRSG